MKSIGRCSCVITLPSWPSPLVPTVLRGNAVLDAPRPLQWVRPSRKTTQSVEDGIPTQSHGNRVSQSRSDSKIESRAPFGLRAKSGPTLAGQGVASADVLIATVTPACRRWSPRVRHSGDVDPGSGIGGHWPAPGLGGVGVRPVRLEVERRRTPAAGLRLEGGVGRRRSPSDFELARRGNRRGFANGPSPVWPGSVTRTTSTIAPAVGKVEDGPAVGDLVTGPGLTLGHARPAGQGWRRAGRSPTGRVTLIDEFRSLARRRTRRRPAFRPTSSSVPSGD